MSARARLFLLLVVLNVLWTPVNLAVQTATRHGMTPAAVALTRWTLVALALNGLVRVPAFARYARFLPVVGADRFRALALGACLFAPAHLLYYLGLTRGASTVGGTVLNATAPLWTGLLAFAFLRERATPRRVAAILLGFAGAWVVVCGFGLPDLGAGNGALLYLLGVVFESVSAVMGTRVIRRSSGIGTLAWEVAGMVPTLLLAPLLLGGAMPLAFGALDPPAVFALAYLVLLPGLLCFGVWYATVERVPLSTMVVTILLQPPLSALLAWRFAGEAIRLPIILGTALVVAALVVVAGEEGSGNGEEAKGNDPLASFP